MISRYAFIFLSAILASLAFPPVGWWPLALVAWVPLWFALRQVTPRQGFYLGCGHGLVLYATSLLWLWNIFGPVAMALWMILAGFSALAAALYAGAARRWPDAWSLPLLSATIWTGIEFYRGEWFTLSFSWITPGLAIGPTSLTPWVGVTGMTFLIMWSAAGLASSHRRQRPVAFGVIALLLTLVVWRPPPVPSPDGERKVEVMAVQGESLDFYSYLELTKQSGFRSGTVVWPEYAALYFAGPSHRPWGEAEDLCRERDLTLVLGTVRHENPGRPGKKFNEALTIDSTGIIGAHVKNRPVHLMDDGEKGTTAMPVRSRAGLVGTPICFDCDAIAVIRRMTESGAEWIAAPTMDALHWGTTEHRQHAELFRHRAAENGRWIVVAATSGITQIIDPHGHRRAELAWPGEGVLRGTVERRNELTPFTRFGYLLGPILFWATLALALSLVFFRKTS